MLKELSEKSIQENLIKFSKNKKGVSAMTQDNYLAIKRMYGESDKLIAQGSFSGAIKLYDKILEIDPKDSKALYNKGTIIFNTGKFNYALKIFNKVLKLNLDLLVLDYKNEHNLYQRLLAFYSRGLTVLSHAR